MARETQDARPATDAASSNQPRAAEQQDQARVCEVLLSGIHLPDKHITWNTHTQIGFSTRDVNEPMLTSLTHVIGKQVQGPMDGDRGQLITGCPDSEHQSGYGWSVPKRKKMEMTWRSYKTKEDKAWSEKCEEQVTYTAKYPSEPNTKSKNRKGQVRQREFPREKISRAGDIETNPGPKRAQLKNQRTKKCIAQHGYEDREKWCQQCKNKKKCTKYPDEAQTQTNKGHYSHDHTVAGGNEAEARIREAGCSHREDEEQCRNRKTEDATKETDEVERCTWDWWDE